MSRVVSTRAVTRKGVGKPDYQTEVWRSQTFKRIRLRGDEQFKMFQRCMTATASPYPWVKSVLATVTRAKLIDASTGLEMPYTIPAGYELEVAMIWHSSDQITMLDMYFDSYLAGQYYAPANEIYYESEVKELSSKDFDPTFASPHTIEFGGTNTSAADMSGFSKVVGILRAHGTVKPETKTVQCGHCGNRADVPVETTLWICPSCGKDNRYLHFPWGE